MKIAIYKSRVVVACTALIFFFSLGLAHACNEIKGAREITRGNYSRSYELLKTCDVQRDASGRALGQLAFLHSWKRMGNFKDEAARARKVFDLVSAASLKGDEDSAKSLATIYHAGEPLLLLDANPDLANCIELAADQGAMKERSAAVSNCLARAK